MFMVLMCEGWPCWQKLATQGTGTSRRLPTRFLWFITSWRPSPNPWLDFGDSWNHRVTLQKVLLRDPRVRLPACISGKRQCPPEDCGGLPGFYRMLDALEDPDDEEHDELKDWVGGSFDPEEFSVEAVNQQLRQRFR